MVNLFQPQRRNRLTKMRIKEISLVDRGAGGDGTPETACEIILAKRADLNARFIGESDRPGAQDTRDAAAKAANMDTVTRAWVANPPAAGESFQDHLERVYGDGWRKLDGAEIARLLQLYKSCVQHASIAKGLAAVGLDDLAHAIAAETGESFAKAYTLAASETQEGREYYAALRGRILKGGGIAHGLEEIRKATEGDGSEENDDAMSAPEDADDTEAGEAHQQILDRAADHMADNPRMTEFQAWARAAQELPHLYAKAYKRSHGPAPDRA